MEFEYVQSVYVRNEYLIEMCFLCKQKGLTPTQAFDEVALSWDDYYYYEVGIVANQVIEEINRRLAQSS